MQKKSNWNIPNTLSVFRLCMVPVFVWAYFQADPEKPRYFALIVYIVAQGTDAVDGYIARKYNMITRLGRVLDPLADKLMSFTVLVCVSIVHPYLWWAAALMFLKECLMGIGALVQYKRVTEVPPSNALGKLATVYFYCVFIALLLFHTMPSPVMVVLLGAGIGLMLAAFATYVLAFSRLVKSSTAPGKDER